MSKVSVKARSGNMKKASDRQRTKNFQDRHVSSMDRIKRRETSSVPSACDDPLGFANASILMAMQQSR